MVFNELLSTSSVIISRNDKDQHDENTCDFVDDTDDKHRLSISVNVSKKSNSAMHLVDNHHHQPLIAFLELLMTVMIIYMTI